MPDHAMMNAQFADVNLSTKNMSKKTNVTGKTLLKNLLVKKQEEHISNAPGARQNETANPAILPPVTAGLVLLPIMVNT